MNIYRMQDEDLWIAAATEREAVDHFNANSDSLGADEIDWGKAGAGAAVALTEAELDATEFVDDITAPDGISPRRSFSAQLAEMLARGDVFPCIFAESE